jgi:bloom syndrome protein
LYTKRIKAIKAAIASKSTEIIGQGFQESTEKLWNPPVETEEMTKAPYGAQAKYEKILRGVFGLHRFRKNQLQVINATTARRDTFVLWPTGSGKSLCFQLPAVFQNKENNSVTVVISPLRSLIDDQVHALRAKDVMAVGLSSDTNADLARKYLLSKTKPALIYCTPEKLQKSHPLRNALVQLYRSGNLTLFAVDEAHCITNWGDEFRDAVKLIF